MIVKVQLSLTTTESKQQVLIYSKNRKIFFEGNANRPLKRLLKNSPKSFWYAELVGTIVNLIKPAPYQDW